jgi:hypothetical protein
MASRKGTLAAAAAGGAVGVLVGQGLLAGVSLLSLWLLARERDTALRLYADAMREVTSVLVTHSFEEET